MNFAHPRAALQPALEVPFVPYPPLPTMQLGTAECPQALSVASRLAALQLQTAALQIELEAQSAADALAFRTMPAALPPPFFAQPFHGELFGPVPAGLRVLVNLPAAHVDRTSTSAGLPLASSDPRQLLSLRSSLPSSVADSPYAVSSISSPVSQQAWQNPAQDPLAVAVAEVAAAAAAAAAAERRSRSLSRPRASTCAAPAGEHALGAMHRSTLDSALRSAVVSAVTPEARGAAALAAAERTAAAGVDPAAASAGAGGAQLQARGKPLHDTTAGAGNADAFNAVTALRSGSAPQVRAPRSPAPAGSRRAPRARLLSRASRSKPVSVTGGDLTALRPLVQDERDPEIERPWTRLSNGRYRCDVQGCGRSFTQKCNMRRHL
jgi:hypothetical protein